MMSVNGSEEMYCWSESVCLSEEVDGDGRLEAYRWVFSLLKF